MGFVQSMAMLTEECPKIRLIAALMEWIGFGIPDGLELNEDGSECLISISRPNGLVPPKMI